jgi:hypothetical protein
VGTRGRVNGVGDKNCGFRQKHFRIVKIFRHGTLSSSKIGGPGLIGGALVSGG